MKSKEFHRRSWMTGGLLVGCALAIGCGRSNSKAKQDDPSPPGSVESVGVGQQTDTLKTGSDAGGNSRTQSTRLAEATADTHQEPNAQLRLISGSGVTAHMRSSKASATLVNLWASWCGPCRREFPMLVGMKENLANEEVEVLFISVDEAETHADAVRFAEENGAPLPIWVAERPLDDLKAALNPEWPGMLPATFLYDSTGKMRYFWGGPVYEHEVLPVVEGLLRGEDVDGETRYGLRAGRDYRE